jgi:hypothetical protein
MQTELQDWYDTSLSYLLSSEGSNKTHLGINSILESPSFAVSQITSTVVNATKRFVIAMNVLWWNQAATSRNVISSHM